MEIKDIQELLKFINRSTLTDVEVEKKDFRLRVQKKPSEVVYAQAPMQQAVMQPVPQVVQQVASPAQPAAAPAKKAAKAAKPAEEETKLIEFKAPFIGTFYRASGPDKEPFAKVGDVVNPGKVLGIIEAMKLFNEIESDISGKIVKILVENAQPVEYDQPLFLVEPI